jgi:hypothetical protein
MQSVDAGVHSILHELAGVQEYAFAWVQAREAQLRHEEQAARLANLVAVSLKVSAYHSSASRPSCLARSFLTY